MNGVRSRAADRGSRTATDNDTHVQWLVAERCKMLESGFVDMKNVEVLAMWSGSSKSPTASPPLSLLTTTQWPKLSASQTKPADKCWMSAFVHWASPYLLWS